MFRLLGCVVLAGFVFTGVAPTHAVAQKKKLEITKKWSGSVEDEKAIKPDVIISAKGLETVWKAWNVKEDVPKVDFTKDMVVAVYSVGSKLDMAGANLDD